MREHVVADERVVFGVDELVCRIEHPHDVSNKTRRLSRLWIVDPLNGHSITPAASRCGLIRSVLWDWRHRGMPRARRLPDGGSQGHYWMVTDTALDNTRPNGLPGMSEIRPVEKTVPIALGSTARV